MKYLGSITTIVFCTYFVQRAELLEQLSQVMATAEEKALLVSTSDMQSNKCVRWGKLCLFVISIINKRYLLLGYLQAKNNWNFVVGLPNLNFKHFKKFKTSIICLRPTCVVHKGGCWLLSWLWKTATNNHHHWACTWVDGRCAKFSKSRVWDKSQKPARSIYLFW